MLKYRSVVLIVAIGVASLSLSALGQPFVYSFDRNFGHGGPGRGLQLNRAVAVLGSDIYVGTQPLQTLTIATDTDTRIYRFRGDTLAWDAPGGGLSGDGSAVYDLSNYSAGGIERLLALGRFSQAGGGGPTLENIASWNGQTWSSVNPPETGRLFAAGVLFDGKIYVSSGRNVWRATPQEPGTSWAWEGLPALPMSSLAERLEVVDVVLDGGAPAARVVAIGNINDSMTLPAWGATIWDGSQWRVFNETCTNFQPSGCIATPIARQGPRHGVAGVERFNGAIWFSGGYFTKLTLPCQRGPVSRLDDAGQGCQRWSDPLAKIDEQRGTGCDMFVFPENGVNRLWVGGIRFTSTDPIAYGLGSFDGTAWSVAGAGFVELIGGPREMVSYRFPGDPADSLVVIGQGFRFTGKGAGRGWCVGSDLGIVAWRPRTGPVCIADLDDSGNVDFNDYLAFLDLFVASDCRADWNGDGTIDFNDSLAFLNDYNSPGC
jgi:hypothetical protein